MDDEHTMQLSDGTRIAVVDGDGKPVVLTAGMRADLVRFFEERGTEPLKSVGDALALPREDAEAIVERLLQAVTECREAALEPLEPPKPPQPRRSKRDRRGSWRR